MCRIFEITEQVQAYMPKADIELINRAYVFAAHAHARQNRRSGELYITHPLAVAKNIVDLKLDVASLVTGLLHDTVEDTHVTLEDIEQRFGGEIAGLVDGVTKIGKIHFRSSEHQKAENFRKMILATAKDLRVLLIKLADRLHNMETLHYMAEEKRKRISIETMEIYAPLAQRLGIHWVAQKLEDLAFSHIEPEASAELQQKMAGKQAFFVETKRRIAGILQEALERQSIDAQVQARLKNLYSVHQKMQRKSLDFSEIYDFVAFRVIVDDAAACYHVLGIIHSLYHPVPGRFKDYIALPKANGYQSLHTAVIGPDNFRIEVQIRTKTMHEYAEDGVASHWIYKLSEDGATQKDHEGFLWLKQLSEMLHSEENPSEFLENVRLDLFVKEVYVFSRDGDLFALPRGSSVLDFAYAIHTDVGNHCVGIRLNGEAAEFNALLSNGDQVEVFTDSEQTPSRDWLKIVKTSRAKQNIRHWLREQEKEDAVKLGAHMLSNALGEAKIGHDMLKFARCNDDVELKEKVGRGDVEVASLLEFASVETFRFAIHKPFKDSHMVAASCCYPIPGDAVTGLFKKGLGFIVHDVRCAVLKKDAAKAVEIDWNATEGMLYKTGIEVFCQNERGSLGLITSTLSDQGANIEDLKIEQRTEALSSIYILLDIQDRLHLSRVLKALKSLKHVSSVRRHHIKSLQHSVLKESFGSVMKSVASFGESIKNISKKTRRRKKK